MEIRRATPADVPAMMPVYDAGRAFMRRSGNKSQWINSYPSRELIGRDAARGQAYLCLERGKTAAVFTFFVGEEPSYQVIREGEWLNNAPYGVIHRLASSGMTGGVGHFVLDWCFRQCGNLRADTHRDNAGMRRLLRESGFVPCGVVTIEDGTDRIAFQRIH